MRELYKLYRDPCILWLQKEFQCTEDEGVDIFQVSVVILYDNVMVGKLQTLTSSINTYLLGIAKNKALELLKAKNKEGKKVKIDAWIDYLRNEDEDLFMEWETKIEASTLALESMGDPCKSLLTYYYYASMRMEEITTLMGYKNADTTKNQKYKCLKRLQKLYYEHLPKMIRI